MTSSRNTEIGVYLRIVCLVGGASDGVERNVSRGAHEVERRDGLHGLVARIDLADRDADGCVGQAGSGSAVRSFDGDDGISSCGRQTGECHDGGEETGDLHFG